MSKLEARVFIDGIYNPNVIRVDYPQASTISYDGRSMIVSDSLGYDATVVFKSGEGKRFNIERIEVRYE